MKAMVPDMVSVDDDAIHPPSPCKVYPPSVPCFFSHLLTPAKEDSSNNFLKGQSQKLRAAAVPL
jgi:hypothetical protein